MYQILLIDNDRGASRLMAARLKAALPNPRIQRCYSLSQARRYLANNHPDVVILDIALPDGDGLDFLKHEYNSNAPWPVIVMSSDTELMTAFSAIVAGASHYFDKSIESLVQLPKMVQHIVRRARLGRFAAKQMPSKPRLVRKAHVDQSGIVLERAA